MKKADYNTKISEIEKKILVHDHSKYITSKELNKLTPESLATRLAQEKLVTKDDMILMILLKRQILMINERIFALFRTDIFGAAHGWEGGGGAKSPHPKIFHT